MVDWGAVILGFFLSIIFGGIFAVIIPSMGGNIGSPFSRHGRGVHGWRRCN